MMAGVKRKIPWNVLEAIHANLFGRIDACKNGFHERCYSKFEKVLRKVLRGFEGF